MDHQTNHEMDQEIDQEKDSDMTPHRVLPTFFASARQKTLLSVRSTVGTGLILSTLIPWALVLWAPSVWAQAGDTQAGNKQQGELFAEPFVVEHYMVQIDEFGERYEAPTVVDTYGGSWIVSERVDHSRLVVDLARAEITEIRPIDGTYWKVSFNRLKELIEKAAELEGTRPEIDPADLPGGKASTAGKGKATKRRNADDWRVEEGRASVADSSGMPTKAASLMSSEGVRHLRLHPTGADALKSNRGGGGGGHTAELWVSPKVKVEAGARAALARFERDALGSEGAMEAAREFADGAFPIRTIRSETKSDGGTGQIEDVVLRLEKIESLDRNLVRIPEGLRRVPHPLEGLVAFLERENQRQKMMSGEAVSTDGYGGGES